MDDKTKKTILAIFATIISLIASILGCVFGIPSSEIDDALDDIVTIQNI